MIEEAGGPIEYDACGSGATVVLVPGSCSTGAAWRPVIAAWQNRFRCVTTALPGYGQTMERRSAADPSVHRNAETVEAVIRKAGGPVHLVGHSFGGLVALAVALRKRVGLLSLTMVEAPAVEVVREEHRHYRAFRDMTAGYFSDVAAGRADAIATMIDFYGGAGTFAAWPPKLRAYAIATTAVNILDWAGAYGFPLPAARLAKLHIPLLVVGGADSPAAMQRVAALLHERVAGSVLATIKGAAHFMIASHASELAELIASHVQRAEAEPSVAA